jgi:hypothetical protein
MTQGSLLLCVFLVMVSPVGWSTTYYVDNCVVVGNDSNNGTSPSTPWLTMSKVDRSTFAPGDSILFRATCVWRDNNLQPPSSGSAGSPITFGSYGSGANPQINMSTVPTSWTNTSGNIWQTAITTQPYQVARNKARGRPVTSEGSLAQNYQWYWASNVLYVYSSTNPNSDGSLWEVAGPVAACINIAKSTSYLIFQNLDLYYSNGTGSMQLSITPPSNGLSNLTFANMNLYMAWGPAIGIPNSISGPGASNISFTNVNVTLASVRTGSAAVFTGLNTVPGGKQPTTNFSWTGGKISYSGNDSNLGTRQASTALNLDNCTNCTVTGLETAYNGSSGINVENASNGVTATHLYLHNDGQSGKGDDDEFEIGSMLYGSSNVTLTNSELSSPTGDNFIISATNMGYNATNVIVEYNLIHGSTTGAGVHIDSGSTGIVFAYNLVYDNARYGYHDITSSYGTPSVSMYNNVYWANGNSSSPANWRIQATGGTTAYNNIIGQANGSSTGNGSEILVLAGDSLTCDYNDWYHAAGGNFMSYHGTAYDFAGWQTATGQDAHSLSVDPQFVSSNPSGPNDFKLRPTSPLIGAGINLGTAYEYGLDTQSADFPYATFNQNLSSLGWDIGAFVFRQSFLLVVR